MARNIGDWAKDRDRERRAVGSLFSKPRPTGKKLASAKKPKTGSRKPKY